jgi:hypothetical protein
MTKYFDIESIILNGEDILDKLCNIYDYYNPGYSDDNYFPIMNDGAASVWFNAHHIDAKNESSDDFSIFNIELQPNVQFNILINEIEPEILSTKLLENKKDEIAVKAALASLGDNSDDVSIMLYNGSKIKIVYDIEHIGYLVDENDMTKGIEYKLEHKIRIHFMNSAIKKIMRK